eukprot:2013349-Prymnesium_polylepis.1
MLAASRRGDQSSTARPDSARLRESAAVVSAFAPCFGFERTRASLDATLSVSGSEPCTTSVSAACCFATRTLDIFWPTRSTSEGVRADLVTMVSDSMALGRMDGRAALCLRP